MAPKRSELLNNLPNGLRSYVLSFEKNILHAERMKDSGEIRDGQLADFYTLIYLAMANYNAPERLDPDDFK